MAAWIYGLCGIMAGSCAWLLLRAYGRSGYRLLFWSGLYFVLSTINNGFLMVDKLIFPESIDLTLWRFGLAFVAIVVLLVGLIGNGE